MLKGHSLVEEGEQVSHDDQSAAGQGQQDLADMSGSLLEALHGCEKTRRTRYCLL